ncbi:hypothetical protein J6590_077541 [Homalodisca vitripennis]|nr:hypothetical protein J6590_077541 [Homalodisca vitripennis]
MTCCRWSSFRVANLNMREYCPLSALAGRVSPSFKAFKELRRLGLFSELALGHQNLQYLDNDFAVFTTHNAAILRWKYWQRSLEKRMEFHEIVLNLTMSHHPSWLSRSQEQGNIRVCLDMVCPVSFIAPTRWELLERIC